MEGKIRQEEYVQLKANGRRSQQRPNFDPVPVLALRAPDGPQAWLLTELRDDGDTAYGLCDLGIGMPECGEVSLAWLAAFRGPLGLSLERMAIDDRWRSLTIGTLARIASAAGRIVL